MDLDVEYERDKGKRMVGFRLIVLPGKEKTMTRLCTNLPRTPCFLDLCRIQNHPLHSAPGKLNESIMATSKTGLVHGTTIELESELEGKRVRVTLEAVDEPRISTAQQRELWQAWAAQGPQGPIEDGPDTELPLRP